MNTQVNGRKMGNLRGLRSATMEGHPNVVRGVVELAMLTRPRCSLVLIYIMKTSNSKKGTTSRLYNNFNK